MKGKIHLKDQYDKNQQILIRVNEGATRNNAVLLPAEKLLLEALFRKGDKVVLTGRRNRVLRSAFLRMQKFYLPRKSLRFTDLMRFCNGGNGDISGYSLR